MRAFFHSGIFKVISVVLALLIVVTVVFGVLGGWASPQTSIAGAALTPIQSFITGISNSVSDFFTVFSRADELERENAELREQINALIEEKLDYQKALNENEFYKDFLELKELNPDYQFAAANVIARDAADQYGAFTIDSGSLDGVSPRDPVITADGLVGYVDTVAPTYSTVVTILSPEVKAGAFDRRTGDSGILCGTVNLAPNGMTRLNNLTRDCSVALGDYIVTSGGGGIFPDGLIIGTVTDIGQDSGEITMHADITPAADLQRMRGVMVITSFEGQASLKDITD